MAHRNVFVRLAKCKMNKVQKQRRPRPWMYRGASLILACLLANVIAAADRPTKPMRETATLPTDKNVLKRFGAIEDYLAEKRWVEAIDVLQEISNVSFGPPTDNQTAIDRGVAAFSYSACRCYRDWRGHLRLDEPPRAGKFAKKARCVTFFEIKLCFKIDARFNFKIGIRK